MKTWLAPSLAFILAVAGIVYAISPGPKPASPADRAAAAAPESGEYVPGVKWITGPFDESRSKVVKADGEGLGPPDVTFDVEVVRAEYMPAEFRVKKGQVVRFRLKGGDNGIADLPEIKGRIGLKEFSGHGFHITGPYGIYVTGIREGVTREVIFKATETGEFDIECVVLCSPDHYLMRGKLIVKE